MRRNLRNGRWK
uniref:Uncharacterized protein n=1 Tax=Rhizophora mucronata TaxID=61149 RepID=A0A2P2NXV0_RHIMU